MDEKQFLPAFEQPIIGSEAHKLRAEERNVYLSDWEKFFGNGKVDSYDLLVEEANSFNREADNLVNDGKAKDYTDAMTILNETKFKDKNKMEIASEEYARAKSLKFLELIRKNKFDEALEMNGVFLEQTPIFSAFEKLDGKDIKDAGRRFGALLENKMNEFKEQILQRKLSELEMYNDTENMKKLMLTFPGFFKK